VLGGNQPRIQRGFRTHPSSIATRFLLPTDHLVATITQALLNETLEYRAQPARIHPTLYRTGRAACHGTGQRALTGITADKPPGAGARATDQCARSGLATDLPVPGTADIVTIGQSDTLIDIALRLGLTDLFQVMVRIQNGPLGAAAAAGHQDQRQQRDHANRKSDATGTRMHLR